MINIKEKLRSATIAFKRNSVNAEYVETNEFDNQIKTITTKLNQLQKQLNDTPYLPPKLMDKTIELSEVELTVTADEGFDGFGSITINAQELYNKAYQEGYNKGKTE